MTVTVDMKDVEIASLKQELSIYKLAVNHLHEELDDAVVRIDSAIVEVAAKNTLLRQALEALEGLYEPGELRRVNESITAIKGALK